MATAWLTGAVAAVDAALEGLGLLGYVTHEPWIGFKDSYGDPDYGSPISRKALIQEGTIPHRRGGDGDVITTRACISFRDPVEPNGAEGRSEPIDPRDRITLPSGLTGPIVSDDGAVINPTTGARSANTVWLR
jgi:hypothetical protein